ncbi:MAG TPA: hypothetical protein VHM24_12775, partial [Gemmatimonadaceae bacterium]|nr:hypothetical protein [Gemmatimonadaceae bacterium]
LSEIPESVAAAVAGQLRIDRSPSDIEKNARAYDIYLRGRYQELAGTPRIMLGRMSVDAMRRAQALYAQARAIDPNFAGARSKLATAHIFAATTYDTTRARLEQARLEAEAALRLDPLLSEPHEALSAYWSKTGNSQKAIEEIEIGLKNSPHHAGLRLALGQRLVEAGRFEDAIAQFKLTARLDPRNPVAMWRAASAYGRTRRNGEGMKAFDRLIEISPYDHDMKLIQGHSYLRWKGSTEKLHSAIKRIPRDWDGGGMATFARYTALRVDRRYRDALAMLDSSKAEMSTDGLAYYPKALMRAELYEGLGDMRNASIQYAIAARLLEDSVSLHPGNGSIHAALGLAYAGLHRKRDAIAESNHAMNITKLSRNANYATAYMGLAIEVFGRVGERDRAFEMIELMLTMPAGREVTIPFLRVWPGYDSLRSDPRFEALLKRFAPK